MPKKDEHISFITDLLDEEYEREEKRTRSELEENQQLLSDVKATFGTSHGRRVLKHLLDKTFMYLSAFTGNSQTYYNVAIQEYGKAILDLVASSDPETYTWLHMQRVNYLHERILKRIGLPIIKEKPDDTGNKL